MNFLANTHCKPSCKHKIKINKTRKKNKQKNKINSTCDV